MGAPKLLFGGRRFSTAKVLSATGFSSAGAAANMLRYIKARPAVCTVADTAAASVIFDMGANNVLAANCVALMGNFEHAHLQMNATNAWTSPSFDQAISLVRATYAATTGYTLPGGGRIKFTAGGLVPRALRGLRVKFATSGTVFAIADNDADEAYIDGADVSAQAGVMSLLGDRAWISFTAARYRYARLLIEIQDTATGYFSVPALFVGMATPLADSHVALASYEQQNEKTDFRTGQRVSVKLGDSLRVFDLTLSLPTVAEKNELVAQLSAHDYSVAPFVLIPDSSDDTDFAVVVADDDKLDPTAVSQFSLALREIL
jgi:hypothetical protein